jgi:hypothetical protein
MTTPVAEFESSFIGPKLVELFDEIIKPNRVWNKVFTDLFPAGTPIKFGRVTTRNRWGLHMISRHLNIGNIKINVNIRQDMRWSGMTHRYEPNGMFTFSVEVHDKNLMLLSRQNREFICTVKSQYNPVYPFGDFLDKFPDLLDQAGVDIMNRWDNHKRTLSSLSQHLKVYE